MKTPASRYQLSDRAYGELVELEYPSHDWTAVITTCGRICYQRRKINLSQVFAGQRVGVKQVSEHSRRGASGLRSRARLWPAGRSASKCSERPERPGNLSR
jgi:hypothetical protein